MFSLWTMIAMTACIGFAFERNIALSHVHAMKPQGYGAGDKKG